MIHRASTPPEAAHPAPLDFLWLELTNRCNLQCVHCYAESGPAKGKGDRLTPEDYRRLIREGGEIGCRQIQFIGGEPTLHRELPDFIRLATECGYETIEVFTNLTVLPERLLDSFFAHRVRVAVSVYSDRPDVHDGITRIPGSHAKTLANIRRLRNAGIPVRAAIVEMLENAGGLDATTGFLREMGVEEVGSDSLRGFGRAGGGKDCSLGDLCGSCSGNTLCVSPDGAVSPCIMSKNWSVGSIMEDTLVSIAKSNRLESLRKEIGEAVFGSMPTEVSMGSCNPDRPHTCGPDRGGPCMPCNPNTRCGPNACKPVR